MSKQDVEKSAAKSTLSLTSAVVEEVVAAEEVKPEEPQVSTTVQMLRCEPYDGPGPKTADVHPDEVDNFIRGGWRLAG